MIVSREDFLLLVQNWKNSSARVRVFVVHEGSPSSDPLGGVFMGALLGEVTGVDSSASFFVVAVGEAGFISVGFSAAEFHFQTLSDLAPGFAEMVADSGEVDELITLALPSGIRLSCMTFK
jgi:hypothetical protein